MTIYRLPFMSGGFTKDDERKRHKPTKTFVIFFVILPKMTIKMFIRYFTYASYNNF